MDEENLTFTLRPCSCGYLYPVIDRRPLPDGPFYGWCPECDRETAAFPTPRQAAAAWPTGYTVAED
jgi:hypothetical protein